VIPDDGMFDITIAVPPSMWTHLGAMASLSMTHAVLHSPTESDSLLCFRSKDIKIECDPPQKLFIDGELTEMNHVKFTTLPTPCE
jgi:diacylglycerol kinase family enzyme